MKFKKKPLNVTLPLYRKQQTKVTFFFCTDWGFFFCSTRHKFMLETIANVKNNKIKNGQTAGGQGDKEMVSKMKKFLNGLSKKRSVRSTEALRVSLDDIRNVETKGKWWLVGSSWKDNLVGTESKFTSMPEDLKKDQSLQEALLKLARKQGMNTDIRRTIFVTIMSSEVGYIVYINNKKKKKLNLNILSRIIWTHLKSL